MTISIVVRPLWRRFRPRHLAAAARHVGHGGCAAVVDARDNVDVLLPVGADGNMTELAEWALLAIDHVDWRRVSDGPARGLMRATIRDEYVASVLDWCDRDRGHVGATREIGLDCTRCAACCHDANVILEDVDIQRWKSAGRDDLAARLYVRRARDGKVTLRFAKDGRCQHLAKDRRCGIYVLRPDNCRTFVTGSEACLSAREETLGLRDLGSGRSEARRR